MPTQRGSFRLFKLFGIEVFLHWSWFIAAILIYDIQGKTGYFESNIWNVIECLTLFLIVLIHEFGHALACRSVGGKANLIVLWPFGGVAYVSPPQRPGATLWSIVAGPLVNVALFPILSVVWYLAYAGNWFEMAPDVYHYVEAVWYINCMLLVFNILPIYPLDGGKILYALLWFVLGRARSLMTACVIGCFGALGLVALAILEYAYSPDNGLWLGAVCVFIFLNLFGGFRQARELLRMANAPRYAIYHCPNCKVSPAVGEFATCATCRKKFDPFQMQLTCPHCGAQYSKVACVECGAAWSFPEWAGQPSPAES